MLKRRTISFMLLILFQCTIGLLGLVLSGRLSQFSWLINMLMLWLGVTLGMYLGGVPFFFQKSFAPKSSAARFATTALGALIPVLFLILLGATLGIHHATYLTVAPILAFATFVFGLLGFFVPSWLVRKPTMA